MARFNAIDLSALPFPPVVVPPDFAAIVAERKADIVARVRELDGDLADALEATLAIEGEMITKLTESGSYREILHYSRVNEAALDVTLAYASGGDLDHLGAYFGVERSADEKDARLRQRVQLAPEAFATTGPPGAYEFHVRSVAPATIKDVGVRRVVVPDAGGERHVEVRISFLVDAGDGTPSSELVAAVTSRLFEEDIKPLTDEILVFAPPIAAYAVDVALAIGEGPDASAVIASSKAAIKAYCDSRHRIGVPVYRNGIIAAAKVAGVEDVTVNSPSQNVAPDPDGAAYCAELTVYEAG